MSRRQRDSEDFNMSFLDIICCGFGAIILLLMITKVMEPVVLEDASRKLEGSIQELQQQLFTIRGEVKVYNRDLSSKREQLSKFDEKIARLRSEISLIKGQFSSGKTDADYNEVVEGRLRVAKQRLSDEMQRLLGRSQRNNSDIVGGIPVDSEYIIFIVDTSGSMFNYAWPRVQQELVSVLNIYPRVKGLQIMNDMGNYMFSRYQGKWIPDTPGRRKVLIKLLRNWSPFSNSSPVEGVTRAIRDFYASGKKVSVYVFGDDFSGQSIRRVMDEIDLINRENDQGDRLVRIHAVGFPVLFMQQSGLQPSAIRFAALMREMTQRNGGTFVGLNDYR